jgi:hypothetical protein
MSNANSLLKANYCRAIMKAANHGPDSEARRLVDGLTTEVTTPGTTPQAAEAEREALLAIHALSQHLHGRMRATSGLEWTRATLAIDRWVEVAT